MGKSAENGQNSKECQSLKSVPMTNQNDKAATTVRFINPIDGTNTQFNLELKTLFVLNALEMEGQKQVNALTTLSQLKKEEAFGIKVIIKPFVSPVII